MSLVKRLAAFLQIRPGEARLAGLVAALFACIEAGRGIGANSADALFFLRFGVEFLPYMYMLLGAANFVISLSYAAGLGRFNRARFFVILLGVIPVTLLANRAALALNLPALYPILWITVNIISSILGLLTWNIAGEVCDARQAKRLFPLFVSAGILGGVAGNFVTGPAAQLLGTENLLLVYAALLLVSLVFMGQITRQFFRPAEKREKSASFLVEVRAGFDFVRRSPLLKLMAMSSVLFSILYFSISFPFNKAVSAAFPSEADVAGFLGAFSGVTTAITFGVSLFVANRLYARIGVVNAVLLLPLTYLAGFVLFAANLSLTGAVIARMSQLVILSGVAGTAYSTFFNVVPSDKRGQVRSFDSGVPEQVGVILSGVLLILGERVLNPTQIFGMGMLVALACAILVWRMRKRYGDALVAALRAGRFEVFSAGSMALAGFRGDANAIRVAIDALRDPKPSTRRLAAEILAEMDAVSAAPALIGILNDPDPDVRVSAIQTLGELGARDALNAIVLTLGDARAEVRASALWALAELEPAITPTLLATIERLLNDTDRVVCAQAAVALARLGEAHRGLPVLDRLLRDEDPAARALALEALCDMPVSQPPAFDIAPVIHALGDASAAVRRAACTTLGHVQAESAVDALVERLGDADTSVRQAAAKALKQLGRNATAHVLGVLRDGESSALDAALDALDASDPGLAEPLQAYARVEISRVQTRRALGASIPQAGRVTRLLRETLNTRAARGEQRLVKAVGLLGDREAMDLVAKSLTTHGAEMRAAAVETLETLGNKQLARDIIRLLDEAPGTPGEPPAPGAALSHLLAQGDGWTRALAARASAELDVRSLMPELRALLTDPDPVARDAAHDALVHFGEDVPMETLQTVSSMERILLLCEVPLFAGLSPDDLKQVADIAREEWYQDGATICREGEEGDKMFVLASGQVKVTKMTLEAEKILATRMAGEFIGEMAVIDSAPRSATVRAEGEVRALVIDGDAFKAILRDRPEVSLAVLRGLSRRLRERE